MCADAERLFAAGAVRMGCHGVKYLSWPGDSVVKWRAFPIALCCFGQLCRSYQHECNTSPDVAYCVALRNIAGFQIAIFGKQFVRFNISKEV